MNLTFRTHPHGAAGSVAPVVFAVSGRPAAPAAEVAEVAT